MAKKTVDATSLSTDIRNPKVDQFLGRAKAWREEFELLREIVLDCHLTEDFKWGNPCYTFEGKNVLIIHGFKEYCAILFVKGALLADTKSVLIQQTENVQAARHVRFTNIQEVKKLKAVLKAYIKEAIEIEKAGLKVPMKKATEFAVAEEFQRLLDNNRAVKAAFYALTPGRQRGYLLHFSAPKQSKTRESRVEKCLPQILDGKGLND